MWNRLGLSPDYDFGAGAYYYADDPALQDLADRPAYITTVPKWIHYLFFFAWGALMWAVWKFIDSRKTPCRIRRDPDAVGCNGILLPDIRRTAAMRCSQGAPAVTPR